MDNIKNKLKELPPDFKICSIVGELFNLQAFIEYSVTINLDHIQHFNFDDEVFISEEQRTEDMDKLIIIITCLPLALMFKNPRMQKYIWEILEKGGYTDKFETFTRIIDVVNKKGASHQSGGGGGLMKYIYALGAIFFAAFYDYYIVTIGSQGIFKGFERVQQMLPLLQGGCNTQYRPSHWVSIASRFTQKPELIQNIEHIIQCAEMPTFFTSQLVEVENRRQLPLLVADFQSQIEDVGHKKPIYNDLIGLPAPDSQEEGHQLVIYGTDFKEINSNLMEKLGVQSNDEQLLDYEKLLDDKKILDDGELLKQVKILANLPPNEFRKLIEIDNYHSPSYDPASFPTANPTFQQAKNYALDIAAFASDVIGAIKEVSPSGAVPSLDPKNLLFWTLQDKLRDFQRKIEDAQKDTTRKVTDIITELSRIGADFASIPSIILYLIGINSAALTAILFFAKKIFGSKPVRGSDQIEELEEVDGGRRLKRKTYRKTHKRNRGIKRKQTKSKKGRRFTRK